MTISTNGPLHYSSILIPAGVTVTFTGTAPAIVRCDGDCFVHGVLDAAGAGSTDGPGAVALGRGQAGAFCMATCYGFGCGCFGYGFPGLPGTHYGTYGSALPFALEGGSPGGTTLEYYHSGGGWFGPCCDVQGTNYPGGGGGGTLVVLAEGRIEVTGVIDVQGGSNFSTGSSGSVLLRGHGGNVVRLGGRFFAGRNTSQGGFVRMDAWGQRPFLYGISDSPPPTMLELPHLYAPTPPRLGTVWEVAVFAPENTLVFLAASLQAGPGTPTPFGRLHLDQATAATVDTAVVPTGSHDPYATIAWLIPNRPALLGLQLWLQGFAAPTALAPRLTNGLLTAVQ
jgi:hypothetical protein